MEARFYDDAAAFWAVAHDLFEADPVKHTTVLSVIHAVLHAPQQDAAPLMLVTLHDDAGSLCGAAMRTPPWALALSGIQVEDAPVLVNALLPQHPELDSVIGPQSVTESFAAAWSAATARDVHTVFRLRLFRLAELTVPAADGFPRLATEADVHVAAQHLLDFNRESASHRRSTLADALDSVRRQFALGSGILLWEVDGVVVSHATAKVPNSGASRIGPVYTPPQHRRRGYAAAATAAAAQWALSAGAHSVLLYTDLANPTANGVYQRIGFRPVTDFAELAFDPRS
ncbi:GNAT family N-acetyltransferase [Kutzneria sp. CA-103260]|uniref:GNAT family N-acetyltransferase n=1 Tax=Kutzneria sp. CA-103260 TaxID=2802641 RepID=UPI001BAC0344|nr:GNAT family N-acetyltransferase [Kutzneria sp. CA-103260]QUQ68945.1 acetyltransferase [Kutzneria sp. CA-103260]